MTDDGQHLTAGWEPDVPPSDTLVRAAYLNVIDRLERTVDAMDGELLRDDVVCAARFAGNSMWANTTVFLAPVPEDRAKEIGDRLDEFYGDGVEAALFSPFPTPDFSGRGWLRMGHPPLMYRPVGGEAPPDPEGIVVQEVTDPEGVLEWEDALARGFPLSAPGQWKPGTLYDARAFDVMSFYVGRVDGEVVCTAAGHVAHDLNQVEWVSTLSEHRGKGYGEAVTWRATLVDPSLPAVLIASDLGRPVYERMGFTSVLRYSGWIKPGAPG